MRPLAQKALETMQKQGVRVIDHTLIDRTLQEIGETYRPGLIGWIGQHPARWRELLAIEARINEVALSREDEVVLKDTLDDYRSFFVEMTKLYIREDDLPLFGRGNG